MQGRITFGRLFDRIYEINLSSYHSSLVQRFPVRVFILRQVFLDLFQGLCLHIKVAKYMCDHHRIFIYFVDIVIRKSYLYVAGEAME